MADERLRSLERAGGGGPEARARRVRERLRAGQLDPERLALAALLGDDAARAALHGAAPAPVELLDDLIEVLVLADAAVQVRVGAAAARAALAVHAPTIRATDLALAEAALAAAEAWVACPCEAHRAQAVQHWLAHLDGEPLSGEVEAQVAAFLAAQLAGSPGGRAAALERLLRSAARALEVDGPGLVRRIAPGLVAWALGET